MIVRYYYLMKKIFLVESFVSVAALLVLWIFAQKFHLFWITDFFDMIMHLVGGLTVAFISFYIFFGLLKKPHTYHWLLALGIGSAFAAGIVWEFYELAIGETHWGSITYISDNGLDMIMDVLGGLIATFYAYFLTYFIDKKHNNE